MDFPDKIIIEPAGNKNGFGDITYGAPYTAKGFYKEMYELNPTGKPLIISGWLALKKGTGIHEQDRITLPNGTQPPIVTIESVRSIVTKKEKYIRLTLGKEVWV